MAFFDLHECWKGALQFPHTDTLPYWRKRKEFLNKSAAVDATSVLVLTVLIRNLQTQADTALKTARAAFEALLHHVFGGV